MKMKSGLKILVALNFAWSSAPAFAGTAKPPGSVTTCSGLYDNCKAWLTDIEAEGASYTDKDKPLDFKGGFSDSKLIGEKCTTNKEMFTSAADECKQAAGTCLMEAGCKPGADGAEPTCPKLDEKKKASYDKYVEADKAAKEQATNLTSVADCAAGAGDISDKTKTPDKPNTGGGGGMDPMMMAAGAALVGGLVGYMMSKKDEKPEDLEEDTGTLEPTGVIDCEKGDSFKYADCDAHLAQTCMAYAGTGNSSAICTGFSLRYCDMNGQGSTPDKQVSQDVGDVSLPVTLGGVGKGIGSAYCKAIVGSGFCKGVAEADRKFCPSCKQEQNLTNPACTANPSLCMPQYSQEDIAVAQQRCPTDPAFSDPKFMAGGASTVPNVMVDEGGLPVAVVPGGTAGTGTTSTPAVAASVNGATVESMSAMSANSNAGSASGYRQAAGMTAQSAGQTLPNVGDASTIGSASSGYSNPVQRGPASDVQGQYGPSLFSVSQQGIRGWCTTYKVECY